MDKDSSVLNFVKNILIILSDLPAGLRNPIIKKRLNEFKTFDISEKREIIRNILESYNKLDESKILNLAESWLGSLAEMDSSDIIMIFNIYLMELYFSSNLKHKIQESFISSLINIVDKLPKNKKDRILTCFFESVLNTPDPKRFLSLIPDNFNMLK